MIYFSENSLYIINKTEGHGSAFTVTSIQSIILQHVNGTHAFSLNNTTMKCLRGCYAGSSPYVAVGPETVLVIVIVCRLWTDMH